MKISNEDWIEYRNNATKYLEQHSQYATRTAVQIAIDKQIELPVIAQKYFYGENYYCPSCEKYIGDNHTVLSNSRFCNNCGQKIGMNGN